MEEIKELEVVEETVLVKPKFEEEIKAEIKGISTIENNIKKVKEYAIQTKEYYAGLTFTEATKSEAEEQKAEINKFKKQVADARKQIIAKYNEPIKLFEDTAKEAEKILGEAYDLINVQVREFDSKELEKVKEKVESYFDEYAASKNINFLKFEDMNLSVTKGLLTTTGNFTKKTQDMVNEFIEKCVKDIELINSLDHKEEILIEYKKTLKAAESIANVMDRYKQLEEMKKQEEKREEQILTDEAMLNKIESLSAPIVEKDPVAGEIHINQVEMLECAFVIRTMHKDCLKEIVEIARKYNAETIQLVKEGGIYHE